MFSAALPAIILLKKGAENTGVQGEGLAHKVVLTLFTGSAVVSKLLVAGKGDSSGANSKGKDMMHMLTVKQLL